MNGKGHSDGGMTENVTCGGGPAGYHEGASRAVTPTWHRPLLTLDEAAEYFGLGINKMREVGAESEDFTLMVGTGKKLYKRRAIEEYLTGAYSI